MTDRLREKAIEIAKGVCSDFSLEFCRDYGMPPCAHIESIQAALLSARDEALEEAARTSDIVEQIYMGSEQPSERTVARAIADRCRSLKSKV